MTSRLQWSQERERWSEQRERDFALLKQQIEADAKNRESDRQRDERAWERTQADEQFRWLRDQKIKGYLEAWDHLRFAGELAANVYLGEDIERKRREEAAIVQELRHAYRWTNSIRAVCRGELIKQLDDVQNEIYYSIQALDNVGFGSDHFVEYAPNKRWILSETIDKWSSKLSDMSRADLGAN